MKSKLGSSLFLGITMEMAFCPVAAASGSAENGTRGDVNYSEIRAEEKMQRITMGLALVGCIMGSAGLVLAISVKRKNKNRGKKIQELRSRVADLERELERGKRVETDSRKGGVKDSSSQCVDPELEKRGNGGNPQAVEQGKGDSSCPSGGIPAQKDCGHVEDGKFYFGLPDEDGVVKLSKMPRNDFYFKACVADGNEEEACFKLVDFDSFNRLRDFGVSPDVMSCTTEEGATMQDCTGFEVRKMGVLQWKGNNWKVFRALEIELKK